jgi:hypothetical protein
LLWAFVNGEKEDFGLCLKNDGNEKSCLYNVHFVVHFVISFDRLKIVVHVCNMYICGYNTQCHAEDGTWLVNWY